MSHPTKLPDAYRVLPTSVPFAIGGFDNARTEGDLAFAPAPIRCEDWFDAFVDRLVDSLGKRFLPVCRMSDGEFLFLFGPQPPLPTGSLLKRARGQFGYLLSRIRHARRFKAGMVGRYASGDYTRDEWRRAHAEWATNVVALGREGILALHLSYGRVPFQERYFPALRSWLAQNALPLTFDNYVPFYFVYALLTGPRRGEVLSGKRVLVVHGARGDKRARIVRSLEDEGASSIEWLEISANRSLFDRVDPTPFIARCDVVILGAGVGKPGLLRSLAPLSVPCIDAGYVFEIWADASARGQRSYTQPDS